MTYDEFDRFVTALSAQIPVFELLVDRPFAQAGTPLLWSRTQRSFHIAATLAHVAVEPAHVRLVGLTTQPDAPTLPELAHIDWRTIHPATPTPNEVATVETNPDHGQPEHLNLATHVRLRSRQSAGGGAGPVASALGVSLDTSCPDLWVRLVDDGLHNGADLCRDPVFRQSLHEALQNLGYSGPALPRAEMGMQSRDAAVFEPTDEFLAWLASARQWQRPPEEDDDHDEVSPDRELGHRTGTA